MASHDLAHRAVRKMRRALLPPWGCDYCDREEYLAALQDLPPVPGETSRQRERRERHNRVNGYLRRRLGVG